MDGKDELRVEAAQRVFESNETEPQHRECWVCEPRKEYLKKIPEVFICYVCGHVYYKGEDITVMDTIEEH